MIPPFTPDREITCTADDPVIARMRRKFETVTADSVSRILECSGTISEEWGHVLRIKYKGLVDGREILPDQMFICWKNDIGVLGICMSSAEEDGFWIKNQQH